MFLIGVWVPSTQPSPSNQLITCSCLHHNGNIKLCYYTCFSPLSYQCSWCSPKPACLKSSKFCHLHVSADGVSQWITKVLLLPELIDASIKTRQPCIWKYMYCIPMLDSLIRVHGLFCFVIYISLLFLFVLFCFGF